MTRKTRPAVRTDAARPTSDPVKKQRRRPSAAEVEPVAEQTAPAGEPVPAAAGAIADPLPEDATAPAERPFEGPCIVQFNPLVNGGPIVDRFDVMLRGRIVSTETVESVALYAEGEEIAVVTYGAGTPPAVFDLPDGDSVEERLFELTLPRRIGREGAHIPCAIEARGFDGRVQRQAFAIDVKPSAPLPIRLVDAPVWEQDGRSLEPIPALLYVERVTMTPEGALTIEGWGVSTAPIVVVQATIGTTRIGGGRIGVPRPDVAMAYSGYPNAPMAGFVVQGHVPDADRDAAVVQVRMLCRHGLDRSVVVPVQHLAPRPAPPPEVVAPAGEPAEAAVPVPGPQARRRKGKAVEDVSEPEAPGASEPMPDEAEQAPMPPPRSETHMFCDELTLTREGWLLVSGWAVSPAGVARIVVTLDGAEVGEAEYGFDRPDVGGQHPLIPDARQSGFRLRRKVADDFDGDHRLEVMVINGTDDVRSETAVVVAQDMPVPEAFTESVAVNVPETFRFELDRPAVTQGRIAEPVTGRLTLEGWVVARSGLAGIDVTLDGTRIGQAHHGLARQDVGLALPEWEGSGRSGFAFHCPPRGMRNGEHEITLTVRARNGEEFVQSIAFEVARAEDHGQGSAIRRKVPRVEIAFTEALLADLGAQPAFHVLLRVPGEPDAAALARTLQALRAQTYRDWRMVLLCDGAEAAEAARGFLREAGASAARVVSPSEGAWTAPLGTDPEALYLLLDPGDEPGADALAAFALDRALHPTADLLYADETRISPVSQEREAFLKPDFSPDLLLSTNYIGRPWIATGALLSRVGATPSGLQETGEYDLVLRCAERAGSIHHVPKVLCQRGPAPADDTAREAIALEYAAARRGIVADVLPTQVPGTFRLRRTAPVKGKVSIVIPTCAAHGYIGTCIRTLRELTTYRDYEIVVIDNIPAGETTWKPWLQENADKVVDLPDAFNWSRFNNVAADVADGEFILFLNDDMEIVEPDWLDALLEHATRPEVGIVGARLLYPDRKLQHGGMFLTRDGIARHAFRFVTEDDPGYFGLARTQRNVIAVTGACMLLRREVFEALGRFDEAHEIVNNDLDLCLRAHAAGLLTVYTPYATLIHHELASRAELKDVYDLSRFEARWGTLFAAGDPYFNPRLSRDTEAYEPDDEAEEVVHPGNPLFLPEDIKEILVVKLDHIGDFITAIPAIRRLRTLFPNARLTVLAPRAARDLAAAGVRIDAFVEFEFFHTRSGLGTKTITAEDLEELRTRLAPMAFDLAVDLRMQPDTRDVLRYTGARYLAGYDHLVQFPFLDISLAWEGDHSLQRKRTHVTDGLLALVDTVGAAARWDRTSLDLPDGAAEGAVERLPDDARALFDGPVVAVHPGVGNPMRQWPPAQFAQLIDLLVEQDDVSVVLIGGPDEAELASEVLERIAEPDRVVSLVGRTPLRDLPGLLASCDLYIGNNSGPKHIAAALGVPTIGIHSGVVDAIEWGPIGACAVAIRRNMACSPCYISRREDCPRDLACMNDLSPTPVHLLAQEMLARPVPVRMPQPLVPVPDWRERAAERVAMRAVAARKRFADRKPAKPVAAAKGAKPDKGPARASAKGKPTGRRPGAA